VQADSGMASPLLPIGENDESAYGVDWTPTREYVANTAHHLTIPHDAVRETPAVLADLSFEQIPAVEEIGGAAAWTYQRNTVISGIAYWFDLRLGPNQWISNAPGVSPGSWGQLFLPLDPPVEVSAGASIEVGVKPERLKDGAPGWLSWWANTGDAEIRGHEFASMPASFADLHQESPDSVPRLNERGRLEARVLESVDGARSVNQIALEISEASAGLSELEALRLVLRALKRRTESADSPITRSNRE
jgi:hypothetical protein